MIFLLLMSTMPMIDCLKCHSNEANTNANHTFCHTFLLASDDRSPYASYGYKDDCKKDECKHDKDTYQCCCSTDKCNTLSSLILHFSQPPSSNIWDFVILPAFIMTVISLIPVAFIFCYMCPPWEKFRHQFGDEIHIDATHIQLNPVPSSSEPPSLADRTPTTPPSAVAVDIQQTTEVQTNQLDVIVEAVITYGTNNMTTNRERDMGLICQVVTTESSTTDILKAVISFGPRELKWESWLVVRIIAEVEKVFLEEETLVKCSVPVFLYGDLHGNYSDLWRWLNFNGWPQKTRSVFLGDYVDRGKHSMEVILLLFLLKIQFPSQIYLCRGNHEEDFVNRTYNFYAELKHRLRNDHYRSTFEKFGKVFRTMPLACLISGRILCLHGGLTPKIGYLNEINRIQRPVRPTGRESEHCGLLWSDPQRNRLSYQSNTHRDEPGGQGVGFLFGLQQIANFVKENDLSLIVRGHQPPIAGYERMGPHLITLFSTAAYRSDRNGVPNMAASLSIDLDGTAVIRRFTVSEIFKEKRHMNKLDKGDEYSARQRNKKNRHRRLEKYN